MLTPRLRTLVLSACFGIASFPVFGADIRLNDWAFNINGTVSEYYAGDLMPGDGGLDPGTGLGFLGFAFDAPGTHSLTAFLDLEFAAGYNTFFNEYGTAHGTPSLGQSWQIDEPGLVFGSIYDNVLVGSLNNTNAIPESSPEDVSFALGWNFSLAAGENAYLSLFISEAVPDTGFYLSHTDPEMGRGFDEQRTVYFWGDLEIFSGGVAVPEPSAGMLLIGGLALVALRRRVALSA